MKVIAVMPAYQEASRVKEAIFTCRPHVDQVIVVDDGSKDETGERASEAGRRCCVMDQSGRAALKTGTIAALRLGRNHRAYRCGRTA